MLLESINSETVGFIPDIKRNVEKNILYSEHGTEVSLIKLQIIHIAIYII